jgi:hypothetical protein
VVKLQDLLPQSLLLCLLLMVLPVVDAGGVTIDAGVYQLQSYHSGGGAHVIGVVHVSVCAGIGIGIVERGVHISPLRFGIGVVERGLRVSPLRFGFCSGEGGGKGEGCGDLLLLLFSRLHVV